MSRLIGSLSLLCLAMAITTMAQPSTDQSPPVLDTNGQALVRGVEYYILPEDNEGGGLTLIDRNNSCPLYVGQEDNSSSDGFPVIFEPFLAEETTVRESHDFIVTFQAFTTCIQSTAWRVGSEDPETGRRFIVTGGEPEYFRIDRNETTYNLVFCPTQACPLCRPRCGSAGILIENGKRLLALDGPAVPVVFKRA